jgi:hypothetical protein
MTNWIRCWQHVLKLPSMGGDSQLPIRLSTCPIFSFWPFFVKVTLCMYNMSQCDFKKLVA